MKRIASHLFTAGLVRFVRKRAPKTTRVRSQGRTGHTGGGRSTAVAVRPGNEMGLAHCNICDDYTDVWGAEADRPICACCKRKLEPTDVVYNSQRIPRKS